jgi:hypothetical protein
MIRNAPSSISPTSRLSSRPAREPPRVAPPPPPRVLEATDIVDKSAARARLQALPTLTDASRPSRAELPSVAARGLANLQAKSAATAPAALASQTTPTPPPAPTTTTSATPEVAEATPAAPMTTAERIMDDSTGFVAPPGWTAPATADEAYARVRDTVPSGVPLSSLSPTQLADVRAAQAYFVDEAVLQAHHGWHDFGNGETRSGDNEEFLLFHRGMMAAFEQSIDPSGGWRLPTWSPADGIPDGFEPLPLPAQIDAENESREVAEGVPLTDDRPENFDETIGTLPDLNALGGVFGDGWHGGVHGEIGGIMSTYYSPLDPMFFMWHGHIDGVVDEWATATGNSDLPELDRATAAAAFWDEVHAGGHHHGP